MGNPNSPDPRRTIFALSSGAPPAAIAILRISGPGAGPILDRLTGDRPEPRMARVRSLRDGQGALLDQALVLWFPGPATATGEDLAELHLHGGRAVVAAVSAALVEAGAALAEPGEFTRRALFNGRLDLAEVEGLADLLAAETEAQRREALLRSTGAFSRQLGDWTAHLIELAARAEAAIDYDGEVEDIAPLAPDIARLIEEIGATLARPPAERLRDGVRVVIAGPPNAGKSSLFNAILGTDAAIVSPIEGTTRDALERPVAIAGLPFLFVDTAGQRETDDPVERIGVGRAIAAVEQADIILDLTADSSAGRTIAVSAKSDIAPRRGDAFAVSAVTGAGVATLIDLIVDRARTLLPREGEVALDRRQRAGLEAIGSELQEALRLFDPLLIAEHLRMAREQFDRLTGRAGIDDMLDALFGRFCLGK